MNPVSISKSATAFALAASLLVSACAGQETPDKQTIGTIIGATIGAIAGSKFGSGSGKSIGVAVGTLAGAWLGGEVGKSLDKADREHLERTTHDTLETARTGETRTWSNPDSGNEGSVTPTRTYETADASPCREFETTVVIDGKPETAMGEACRQEDGSWQIVR